MVNDHTHSSLGARQRGVAGVGGLRWREPRSSRRTEWRLELLLFEDDEDTTKRTGSVLLAGSRGEAEAPGCGGRGGAAAELLHRLTTTKAEVGNGLWGSGRTKMV